jgi:hypothetical protein
MKTKSHARAEIISTFCEGSPCRTRIVLLGPIFVGPLWMFLSNVSFVALGDWRVDRFACLSLLSLSALVRFSPGRYGKKLVYKAVENFVNFRGGTIFMSGTEFPGARIL